MKQPVLIIDDSFESSKGVYDSEKNSGGFDQDFLAAVQNNEVAVFKVESVRDQLEFRKAMVDDDEDYEGDGDVPLAITDWELV